MVFSLNYLWKCSLQSDPRKYHHSKMTEVSYLFSCILGNTKLPMLYTSSGIPVFFAQDLNILEVIFCLVNILEFSIDLICFLMTLSLLAFIHSQSVLLNRGLPKTLSISVLVASVKNSEKSKLGWAIEHDRKYNLPSW